MMSWTVKGRRRLYLFGKIIMNILGVSALVFNFSDPAWLNYVYMNVRGGHRISARWGRDFLRSSFSGTMNKNQEKRTKLKKKRNKTPLKNSRKKELNSKKRNKTQKKSYKTQEKRNKSQEKSYKTAQLCCPPPLLAAPNKFIIWMLHSRLKYPVGEILHRSSY